MPRRCLPSVAAVAALAVSVAACGGGATGGSRPGGTNGPAGATRLVAAVSPLSGPTSPSGAGAVAAAEERFALALTSAAYRADGPGRNVLLSPFSAAADLAMLQLGSGTPTSTEVAATLREEGMTAAELVAGWRTLAGGLRKAESPGELQLASSVWLSRHLHVEPGFLDVLASGFGNETYQVDFTSASASQAVNAWVRAETAGRITQLFSPGDLPPATEVVLADALHFHAAWAPTSNVSRGTVESRPFSTADGATPAPVPTIVASDVLVDQAQGSGYEAVEIPYTNGRFAALLVEPLRTTLGSFLSSLTTAGLDGILGALRPSLTNLAMPVLHESVDATLDGVLAPMGLGPLYREANFAPMLGPAGAVNQALGTVKQAATLDVTPWGTEASAATGASIVPTLAVARSVAIDHPYLLLLRDTVSGAILFTSLVADPAR